MIIGLTGKVGAGKHTAADFLAKKGYQIIDVDRLTFDLYKRGSPIWHQLVDLFGKKILSKNLEINRKKLAAIVFDNEKLLNELNVIVHPVLVDLMRTKISELITRNYQNIVVVAALGDQLELSSLVEKTVLISADLQKRIDWLKANRDLKEPEIRKRDILQKEPQIFNYKIQNDGNIKLFEKRILSLLD